MAQTEGLLIKDVVRLTGLHHQTIRDLDRRGIITSTRDARGWRVFDPAIVPFLNSYYKRVLPHPSPIMDALFDVTAKTKAFVDSLTPDERAELHRRYGPTLLPPLDGDEAHAGAASDGAPVDLEVEHARRAARPLLRSVQGGRAS